MEDKDRELGGGVQRHGREVAHVDSLWCVVHWRIATSAGLYFPSLMSDKTPCHFSIGVPTGTPSHPTSTSISGGA